jgi:hypothetical protein
LSFFQDDAEEDVGQYADERAAISPSSQQWVQARVDQIENHKNHYSRKIFFSLSRLIFARPGLRSISYLKCNGWILI